MSTLHLRIILSAEMISSQGRFRDQTGSILLKGYLKSFETLTLLLSPVLLHYDNTAMYFLIKYLTNPPHYPAIKVFENRILIIKPLIDELTAVFREFICLMHNQPVTFPVTFPYFFYSSRLFPFLDSNNILHAVIPVIKINSNILRFVLLTSIIQLCNI